MKVEKAKWYHRLWNVCVAPIVVAMVTVFSAIFLLIYIIFGGDAAEEAMDWPTGLWFTEY